MPSPGTAYLVFFWLASFGTNANQQNIVLRVSPVARGQGGETGPDLSDQFEGNWEITVKGKTFTHDQFSSDTSEPYSWIGNSEGLTDAAITEFRNLIDDLQDDTSVTLILNDGATVESEIASSIRSGALRVTAEPEARVSEIATAIRTGALEVSASDVESQDPPEPLRLSNGIYLPIGAPTLSTADNTRWEFSPGIRIDPALVVGGAEAYLTYLNFLHTPGRGENYEVRLQVASTPYGNGSDAGPELTEAWEGFLRALSMRLGSSEWQIQGPALSGFWNPPTDTTEPYEWNPRTGTGAHGGGADIDEFGAQYPGASNKEKTQLRLWDGAAPAAEVSTAISSGALRVTAKPEARVSEIATAIRTGALEVSAASEARASEIASAIRTGALQVFASPGARASQVSSAISSGAVRVAHRFYSPTRTLRGSLRVPDSWLEEGPGFLRSVTVRESGSLRLELATEAQGAPGTPGPEFIFDVRNRLRVKIGDLTVVGVGGDAPYDWSPANAAAVSAWYAEHGQDPKLTVSLELPEFTPESGGRYVFRNPRPPEEAEAVLDSEGRGAVAGIGIVGRETLPAIVSQIRPFNDLSAQLLLIPRGNAIHDAETGEIPAYDPRITLPSGDDSEFVQSLDELLAELTGAAEALNGVDGSGYEFIFIRTAGQAPAQPVATTPQREQNDYIPDGWSDNPPAPTPTEPVVWWCGRKGSNLSWGQWAPVRVWTRFGEDGRGVEFIFRATSTDAAPARPTYSGTAAEQRDEYRPSGWSDDPISPTPAARWVWYCIRRGRSGEWGEFSAPAISATLGVDGPGAQFVFARTAEETAPDAIVTTTAQRLPDTEHIPSGWEDEPQGPTPSLPFEWVSERKLTRGASHWSEFSAPSRWAVYTRPIDSRTPNAPIIEPRARGLSSEGLYLFRVFFTPADLVGRQSIESIEVAVSTDAEGHTAETGFQLEETIVDKFNGARVGSALVRVQNRGLYYFSGRAHNPEADPEHGPWSAPVAELTSVEVGDRDVSSGPGLELRRPDIAAQGVIATITRPVENYRTGYSYQLDVFTRKPPTPPRLDYITGVYQAHHDDSEKGKGLIRDGLNEFFVSGAGWEVNEHVGKVLFIYRDLDPATEAVHFPLSHNIISNSPDTLVTGGDAFRLPDDATLPIEDDDLLFNYIIGRDKNNHWITRYPDVVLSQEIIVVVQGRAGREIPLQTQFEFTTPDAVFARARFLNWYGLGESSAFDSVGSTSGAPGAPSLGDYTRSGNTITFPFEPGARNEGHEWRYQRENINNDGSTTIDRAFPEKWTPLAEGVTEFLLAVVNNKAYQVEVRAKNSDGVSFSDSLIVDVYQPPGKPTVRLSIPSGTHDRIAGAITAGSGPRPESYAYRFREGLDGQWSAYHSPVFDDSNQSGSFLELNLNPNTRYYFEVIAEYSPAGDVVGSAPATANIQTPAAAVPNAPGLGVEVRSGTSDEVEGTITPSQSGIAPNKFRWRVRRGTSGSYGNWFEESDRGTSSGGVRRNVFFTDTGLDAAITYYYQAQAGNDNGWSSSSPTRSVTTPSLGPPSRMAAPASAAESRAGGWAGYKFTWPAQSANPAPDVIRVRYQPTVYRHSSFFHDTWETVSLSGSETSWTTPDLTPGLSYNFEFTVENPEGRSPDRIITLTTPVQATIPTPSSAVSGARSNQSGSTHLELEWLLPLGVARCRVRGRVSPDESAYSAWFLVPNIHRFFQGGFSASTRRGKTYEWEIQGGRANASISSDSGWGPTARHSHLVT